MTDFFSRTFTTGDGAQASFTFNWNYLAVLHIHVKINGLEIDQSQFSVDGNTLTFLVAPVNGASITIFRQTPLDAIQSLRQLGTPSSGGFNLLFLRIQYIAQEVNDVITAGAIVLDSPGVYNAGGGRLTGLADGINGQDAATVAQVGALSTGNLIPSFNTKAGQWARVNAIESAFEYVTSTVLKATLALGALADKNIIVTGDITDGSVTLAKLANMTTARLLGRTTAGNGPPELISVGTNLSLAAGVLNVTTPVAFPTYFVSANQTISNAGALTIPHGLGRMPVHVDCNLICGVAVSNIPVGRVIKGLINSDTAATNSLNAVTWDATNIYVKFAASTTCFIFCDLSTAALVNLPNADFAAQFVAF